MTPPLPAHFAVAVLVLCACATQSPPPQRPPPSSDVAAAAMAAQANTMKLQAAVARGEAECAHLSQQPVSWGDERGFGGVFAAQMLRGRSLYLDAPVSKDSPAPAAGKLPAGPKNDVTGYVQLVGATIAGYSSRPNLPWVFGVIDDPTPSTSSVMGGYVFITTGLLSRLKNEAELAAALAVEIASIAQRASVSRYGQARAQACKIAVTGAELVAASTSDIPGASDFLAQSRSQKTFHFLDGVSFQNDPEVDHDYVVWFVGKVLEAQNRIHPTLEDQAPIDEYAVMLLGSAGYDQSSLTNVLALYPHPIAFDSHLLPEDRIQHLQTERAKNPAGLKAGKTPAFPKNIVMPTP